MSEFLKKILWATDFSDEAQEALLYAEAFAKTFKADLIALHVVPDFSPVLYNTDIIIKGDLIKKVDFIKGEAVKKLDNIEKTKKIPFKTIVKEGSVSKKILETAEEEKVDLVVMGKRGLSAIEKLFIGSIANQILRTSSVPLLLTKKKAGKPHFKKVLVPTDFSEQEEVERDFAWNIARGFASEITLLYVLELHNYEFTPRDLEKMFTSVMKRLKKRKKRGKDIKVSEEVTRAINASIGIVDYAETNNFDLIVMSTCCHSKWERFFLGSTIDKVISYSSVPIFAIPPSSCPS